VNHWQEAPIFGERDHSVQYTVRPSAYCLIEDASGRLALVRTPQGIYLPGGGIEAGETPAQAVVRESLEECGFIVRAGSWELHAVQFCYSEAEKKYFEKRCTFVDAIVESAAPSGTEPGHELLWVAPAAALDLMLHECHGWAIQAWTNRATRQDPNVHR